MGLLNKGRFTDVQCKVDYRVVSRWDCPNKGHFTDVKCKVDYRVVSGWDCPTEL